MGGGGSGATVPSAFLSSVVYCSASVSMVLSNKLVLSQFDFPFTNSILLFQTLFAVLFLLLLRALGFIQFENLEVNRVKQWLPVTAIFVIMLWTGMYSLKHISVPLFTVFKNMTNLIIAVMDKLLFGNVPNQGTVFAICLMVFSSICTAGTDIEQSFLGYFWVTMNCLATASYALYMKVGMGQTKLSEFGMAFYNNTLSVPFMLLLVVMNGEHSEVLSSPMLAHPPFMASLIFSGGVGAGLSFCTYWCAKSTSPTTYSIIGSLNKVPIAILGIILFNVEVTASGAFSIAMGLVAGFVFALSKTPMGVIGTLQSIFQSTSGSSSDAV